MSRFFLLLAFAALLCVSAVSGQSLCAGAGYDLSALAGQQFSYYDGSYWTYALSPCGVVNNATACPNPNYPNTAFCQTEPGRNGTSLGQYTAENSTWYASADGKTVTQFFQDGTPCGNFNRETSFVYMCDPTATTARLVNATEVHACYVSYCYAHTRLVSSSHTHRSVLTLCLADVLDCYSTPRTSRLPPPARPPTADRPVRTEASAPPGMTRDAEAASTTSPPCRTRTSSGMATPPRSTLCGTSECQFQPPHSPTLASDSAQTALLTYRCSHRVLSWCYSCGAVAHPNCSATAGQGGDNIPATQTAMLCQSDQANPTGNDHGAAYYIADQQMWTITSTGLRLTIQDGQACGNFNREAEINFVCNQSATTAVMTSVVEPHTCYVSTAPYTHAL